jgi:hypothetical protein
VGLHVEGFRFVVDGEGDVHGYNRKTVKLWGECIVTKDNKRTITRSIVKNVIGVIIIHCDRVFSNDYLD